MKHEAKNMKDEKEYLGRKLLGSLILAILIVVWLEVKWPSLICIISFMADSCGPGDLREAWESHPNIVIYWYSAVTIVIWAFLYFAANLIHSVVRSGSKNK